jgi:hypothetical protein
MRELACPILSISVDSRPSSLSCHECSSSNSLSERCRFCRICGIFMPTPLSFKQGKPDTQFFRSNRFSTQEFNGSNFNTVTEEMIARQSVNRYYNTSLGNLDSRDSSIEWIKCLCKNLSYSLTTFYLAVAYIDAILSFYSLKRHQLKLICYVCVILAAKMEEVDRKIPSLGQSIIMLNHEYTPQDIMARERLVVSLLEFNLNLKTPFTFLMFFFARGFVSDLDLQGLNSQTEISTYIQNIEDLALFFMDMMVKRYEYYQFTSIAVAAAALTCARICVGIQGWSSCLERLTFVSWDAIQESLRLLFSSFEQTYPEMFKAFIVDKPYLVQSYRDLLPKSNHFPEEPSLSGICETSNTSSPRVYSLGMSSSANHSRLANYFESEHHQALSQASAMEIEPQRKLTGDTCDDLLNSKNDEQQINITTPNYLQTRKPVLRYQDRQSFRRSHSRDLQFKA